MGIKHETKTKMIAMYLKLRSILNCHHHYQQMFMSFGVDIAYFAVDFSSWHISLALVLDRWNDDGPFQEKKKKGEWL